MILPLKNNASNMLNFSLVFQCIFIQKHLLTNYYKPDTVLGHRDIAQSKRDKIHCLRGTYNLAVED